MIAPVLVAAFAFVFFIVPLVFFILLGKAAWRTGREDYEIHQRMLRELRERQK